MPINTKMITGMLYDFYDERFIMQQSMLNMITEKISSIKIKMKKTKNKTKHNIYLIMIAHLTNEERLIKNQLKIVTALKNFYE